MVWFGLDRQFGQTGKINGFWYALVEFGLICRIEFALLIPHTNDKLNKYLIYINLICEFLLGYSTDKQTN